MRFRAPARAEVDPERFAHPVFAGYHRHLDLLTAQDWPTLSRLNEGLACVDTDLRFVEQDADLLADGLHYEQRIADQGRIATRSGNWHDLLNALIWIEHAPLKRALNARQVADIAQVGPRQRTRAQCALTHFDEAGVLVLLAGEVSSLLAAWDRHDWQAVFVDQAPLWKRQIELVVFGHALLEHALVPGASLVGKCLLVEVGTVPSAQRLTGIADAIAAGRTLNDPQELRPLPMLGLPGWHPRAGEPAFYQEHASFQPIRPGRLYPPPLLLS